MWNDNINISTLSYSVGHIDCHIASPFPFYLTGFYGNPNPSLHYLSWSLLDKIAATHTNTNSGWLEGGDSNEIMYDSEKRGGTPLNLANLNAFHNALNSNTLTTLGTSSPSFT